MHPYQDDIETVVYCEAPVFDQRDITDSGGHTEQRYVIKTQLVISQHQWPIELTLTNRDTMKFRMLLGRSAMTERMIVNPAESYLLGQPDMKKTAKAKK